MSRILRRIRLGISRRAYDRRVQRRLQIGSSLALGVGLLISASIFFGLFDSPQSSLADLVYQPRQPSGQVVIIAIDNASIQRIGPWPWPRATLADLVRAINQAQPGVIALDLILPEPSSDDAALAQAISSAPRVIQPILGVEATRFASSQDSFPRFDAGLKPSPVLQTDNTMLAHTLIMPDEDGVVRRIAVAIDASNRRYSAFGIAALEATRGYALAGSAENGQIAFGPKTLPVDQQGQMRLNFVSWNAERTISAADVLQGRVRSESLRDKLVLVGLMGMATHETFQTPLSLGARSESSVQIHANVIETILGNYFLVEQDRLTQILVILLVALLAGATLPHVRLVTAGGLALLYFAMYLSYAFQKFDEGIVVQPLYPILALFLTSASIMVFRYFSEERPRALLGRLFRRYVSPESVDQVLSKLENGALPLSGMRREVSVLYVDLREFGPLTESMAPETAVKLLNQYMTLIVGVIFRHGGSLSKHTGDTIIAVWNLPLDQADHARRAVWAALEIRREVAAIHRKQPKETTIQVGIGIGTGDVIAGHVGASSRAEYTILGEVLAMAERMAMKADRGVFIDRTTRDRIGSEFETREVNPVRLRRRTDPVFVWEIVEPMEAEKETEATGKNGAVTN